MPSETVATQEHGAMPHRIENKGCLYAVLGAAVGALGSIAGLVAALFVMSATKTMPGARRLDFW